MHPYVIDRMVQERREELQRLARAGRGPRAPRGTWFGRRRGRTAPAPSSRPRPEMTPACCPG